MVAVAVVVAAASSKRQRQEQPGSVALLPGMRVISLVTRACFCIST